MITEENPKKKPKTQPKLATRKDGEEFNSNKYIELRPTMEEYISDLCETILNISEMNVGGEIVATEDLILSVIEESFEDFVSILPSGLKHISTEIYETLENYIDVIGDYNLNIISEARVMDLGARRKKAAIMRRHKAKILSAKRRAERRRADQGTLERRAERKARLALKRRFTGKKSYNSMSPSEKLAVDKRMERLPKSVLQRLATKMIPKVKQAETERLKNAGKNKEEDDKKKAKKLIKQTSKKAVSNNKVQKSGYVGQKPAGQRKVVQSSSTTKTSSSTTTSKTNNVKESVNALFEGEFGKKDLPKK